MSNNPEYNPDGIPSILTLTSTCNGITFIHKKTDITFEIPERHRNSDYPRIVVIAVPAHAPMDKGQIKFIAKHFPDERHDTNGLIKQIQQQITKAAGSDNFKPDCGMSDIPKDEEQRIRDRVVGKAFVTASMISKRVEENENASKYPRWQGEPIIIACIVTTLYDGEKQDKGNTLLENTKSACEDLLKQIDEPSQTPQMAEYKQMFKESPELHMIQFHAGIFNISWFARTLPVLSLVAVPVSFEKKPTIHVYVTKVTHFDSTLESDKERKSEENFANTDQVPLFRKSFGPVIKAMGGPSKMFTGSDANNYMESLEKHHQKPINELWFGSGQ